MATSVTVRMYNQQDLGDCFLLCFKNGDERSYMLIDFGSYVGGNANREIEIAKSIIDEVKGHPFTIVVTHQHKDHLTGFISAQQIFSDPALNQNLEVSNLWFSYLDDPDSKEGKAVRKRTEQFWKKNKEAKKKAASRFGRDPQVKRMLAAKKAIDLFAEDQQWGEAYSLLLDWVTSKPLFLLPGKVIDIPGIASNAVKAYVLGPPKDVKLLKKLNPSKGDAVHELNATDTILNLDTSSTLMLDALQALSEGKDSMETENFPFNKKFSYTPERAKELESAKRYRSSVEKWRRIDHDWLAELGRVSLHMGNLTNNSSLVLAFEIATSKKVLLFAGDAQIGNWKSWFDVKFEDSEVSAEELLSRTVFYKAGHHSSHNATLKEGLDLMNEKELVIMIPVNEKVSKKMDFAMLQPGMLKGYNRKSTGRVIRADTVFQKQGAKKILYTPFREKEKRL